MLIDTHCHLDFPEFDNDRNDVITRAREAGIGYLINVASSAEGSVRSSALAQDHSIIYSSVGIHPHYAKDCAGKIPAGLEPLFDKKKVVAIGEVGLDYYRNLSPKLQQKSLFEKFIGIASQRGLPLIIHSREADEDTFSILKGYSQNRMKGVMHCYSAGEKYLAKYLDMGFYISFTGNLTFKNAAGLRDVARKVPVDRLLVETDAPFLAPRGFRGKRNEPAFIIYLVEELARIYRLSEDDVARITTHNAGVLFGLPVKEETKIAYAIRDSLYLNITNRCTNDCTFCVRNTAEFVKGHKLKLDSEPSAEDIVKALGDVSVYKEVVFCGYGEPTLRLDVVKKVAALLKKKGARTRMVTNGQADLIHKRHIAGELAGLIDKVSVSLNVDDNCMYNKVCRSIFGEKAFEAVKEFIRQCKLAGIEVEVTFLNLPDVQEEACAALAKDELKSGFRMRRLNDAG